MLSLVRCAASPIWIALLELAKTFAMQKSYTLDYTPGSSLYSHRCQAPVLRQIESLDMVTLDESCPVRLEELSQLAIQSLEGYFRSHPQSSERLAQANAVIAHEGWQDRKVQKPFRVEYETRNGQYVK
jgi:hypothetical protein